MTLKCSLSSPLVCRNAAEISTSPVCPSALSWSVMQTPMSLAGRLISHSLIQALGFFCAARSSANASQANGTKSSSVKIHPTVGRIALLTAAP